MKVDNPDLLFNEALCKYLDKESKGEIKVAFYLCEDAGEFYREKNLRFWFHSKELCRHNERHVHVTDTNHDREATIRILDGKMLDGNLISKDLKKARDIIESNKKDLLIYWNTKTDGMIVDLNNALGITDY